VKFTFYTGSCSLSTTPSHCARLTSLFTGD